MKQEVVILEAEDEEGHADLIRRNLRRAGITNQLLLFKDGQEISDFLFRTGEGPHREPGARYILLLDIRMPKVSGTEILRKIKADAELRKMPVIMITTSDDPYEIELCHKLGCNNFITKPVEYEAFANAVRQLGQFLSVVQIPKVNGVV
ncbi:MAG: response regulator [Thermotogota bacterium]